MTNIIARISARLLLGASIALGAPHAMGQVISDAGLSGTVTSVGCGSGLSGGTITTTGTCSLNLGNANTWTAAQQFPTGSAAAPSISLNGTTAGLFGGTNVVGFATSGALAGEIDVNGRWILSSSLSAQTGMSNNSATPYAVIANNTAASGANSLLILSNRAASTTSPGTLYLAFAKSTTIGNEATVASGDQIGNIIGSGADGTHQQDSSQILFKVGGAVSAGVVPGEMDFLTATTGGTKTLALKIDDAQGISMPGLATSSAAQTGTVCSGTGGLLTVDTTTTCLASSIRFKRDVMSLGDVLPELAKLRAVSFTYKTDAVRTPHFGLIAEEVAAIDPRLVSRDKAGQPLGVRYIDMISMLVRAVQEQQAEIAELRRRK